MGGRPGSPSSSWTEDLWAVRDCIEQLEAVKDEILSLLGKGGLEERARRMWAGDAKEAYYGVTVVWQLLESAGRSGAPEPGEVLAQLGQTRSEGARVASELASLAQPAAQDLRTRWLAALQACTSTLDRLGRALLPQDRTRVGSALAGDSGGGVSSAARRARAVTEDQVELLCSECGAPAVVLELGAEPWTPGRSLICRGIIRTRAFGLEHAEAILGLARRERLAELQEYLCEHLVHEGMDAYCPECDRLYCADHYLREEEYDAGFYDCTFGTCPAGHRRIIDD